MVDAAEEQQQPRGFNPLAAVRRLKAVGIKPDQAEAITDEIIAGQGELATKADLATLRAEVRADLKINAAELRTEIRTIALSVVAILIAAMVAVETLL